MKTYFVALKPVLNQGFYEKINQFFYNPIYPNIKLPFHLTLYFLSQIEDSDKHKIIDWINTSSLLNNKIKCNTLGISSFKKDGKDFVFFLKMESEKVMEINKDLSEKFGYLHKDSFNYIPHVSLFFPDQSNEIHLNEIDKIFSEYKEIEFTEIFLGSEVDGKIFIEYSKSL